MISEINLLESICSKTSTFRGLTVEILLNMTFICDWKHSIEFGNPIASNDWHINGNKIRNIKYESIIFSDKPFLTTNKDRYDKVSYTREMKYTIAYSASANEIVCAVLDEIGTKSDYIIQKFVLSSYPFRYRGKLDLLAIGEEYRGKFGTEYERKKIA